MPLSTCVVSLRRHPALRAQPLQGHGGQCFVDVATAKLTSRHKVFYGTRAYVLPPLKKSHVFQKICTHHVRTRCDRSDTMHKKTSTPRCAALLYVCKLVIVKGFPRGLPPPRPPARADWRGAGGVSGEAILGCICFFLFL